MLRPNPGHCPAEAAGRRVRVRLASGHDTALREPGGWAADGRGGCDWSRGPGRHAIAEWELIR